MGETKAAISPKLKSRSMPAPNRLDWTRISLTRATYSQLRTLAWRNNRRSLGTTARYLMIAISKICATVSSLESLHAIFAGPLPRSESAA